MRNGGAQPLPTRGAPVEARHLRARVGLVDEDEAMRVEVELALEPFPSPLQDVGTVLEHAIAERAR